MATDDKETIKTLMDAINESTKQKMIIVEQNMMIVDKNIKLMEEYTALQKQHTAIATDYKNLLDEYQKIKAASRNGTTYQKGKTVADRHCHFWMKGKCKFGKDCRFMHDPAKKGTADNDGGFTPSVAINTAPKKDEPATTTQ